VSRRMKSDSRHSKARKKGYKMIGDVAVDNGRAVWENGLTSCAEAGSGGVQPAKDISWRYMLPLAGEAGLSLAYKLAQPFYLTVHNLISKLFGAVYSHKPLKTQSSGLMVRRIGFAMSLTIVGRSFLIPRTYNFTYYIV
jgi:hypothetical protein